MQPGSARKVDLEVGDLIRLVSVNAQRNRRQVPELVMGNRRPAAVEAAPSNSTNRRNAIGRLNSHQVPQRRLAGGADEFEGLDRNFAPDAF